MESGRLSPETGRQQGAGGFGDSSEDQTPLAAAQWATEGSAQAQPCRGADWILSLEIRGQGDNHEYLGISGGTCEVMSTLLWGV